MSINIAATDSMVGEYLIYRGFTQTFQSLEVERNRDKVKRFEVTRIVEAIFSNLQNFEIESFISLWDFLNKRFFFHLDAEHVHLCGIIKSDLLKYYLVYGTKQKNKEKVTEFFSMFSHEILADSAEFIPGNLRNWYVLPYIDDPEKDNEFSVYFSQRWSDLLRITLHNFLSVVLSTAPPPKLLLLERWFRSEAQQEMRSQLKLSTKKINTLINRLETNEQRLQNLRDTIKDLVQLLHKTNLSAPSRAAGSSLFENDDEAAIANRNKQSKDLGVAVVKQATECAKRSANIEALPRDRKLREILGRQSAAVFFKPFDTDFTYDDRGGSSSSTRSLRDAAAASEEGAAGGGGGADGTLLASVEELEQQLILQVQQWIKSLP